jgi:ABC-type multidrug transport system ATPase subunit
MTDVEPQETGAVAAVPLFAACSATDLAAIASRIEAIEVPAGTIVFHEGDPGDDMYIVAEGQVRIVSDTDSEKVVFAHLGPGDFFGEMALITGAPRSAAAIATTDVRLWRLSKNRFDRILAENPQVGVEMSRVLGERVAHGNHHRFQNEAFALLTLTPERDEVTIGRWQENDLVLDDPQVAGVHARIQRIDGRWVLSDEDSTSGTYVNRRRVSAVELRDGDEILIGTFKVFLDGLTVKSFVGRDGVRIDATGLTKVVSGAKRILDGISLSIYPGELVAIVGGSGTGKTTLLHVLNGFSPANSGDLRYNGVSLYENLEMFRPVLGYVPQDDIVHPELTVERTLFFAARLRLPADTRADEIAARTEEALAAVGLTDRRHTPVHRLSGGQRKRVSVAVELLARPRAFFLDEPTSGLDPALEGRLMALFSELAERGATVIVSTHVTQNLRMCDKIAWMGRGGHLVFFGSPAEALRHFGVAHFGEIYDLLEAPGGIDEWSTAFIDSPAHRSNVTERLLMPPTATGGRTTHGEPTPSPSPAAAGQARQFFWLTARYLEVLARDSRNLALLLLQAPAIGLALLLLYHRHVFALTAADGGDAHRAMMSLHMMTASAIWLGASNAAREITKESAIYSRERLVNLGVLPYVLSKVVVLSLLCLVQVAVVLGVFVAGVDLSSLGSQVYPMLLAVIFLTALGGLSMGLLVSSVAGNSDRAMAIVPILLIPQIMFAGAQVPVLQMLAPARWLSQLMISKWSLELAGNITDLAARFQTQFPAAIAHPYQSAFEITPWIHWLALVGFVLVLLAATLVAQARKDAR